MSSPPRRFSTTPFFRYLYSLDRRPRSSRAGGERRHTLIPHLATSHLRGNSSPALGSDADRSHPAAIFPSFHPVPTPPCSVRPGTRRRHPRPPHKFAAYFTCV